MVHEPDPAFRAVPVGRAPRGLLPASPGPAREGRGAGTGARVGGAARAGESVPGRRGRRGRHRGAAQRPCPRPRCLCAAQRLLRQRGLPGRYAPAERAGALLHPRPAPFSSEPGCGCSSLGRYKVGYAYNGSFGKAFKLHGLDASNRTAYARFVVLHAYRCVPDEELYPAALCNSLGCPMLSHKFLETAAGYIRREKKPVLLWIYQ
ncbi:MAG: hypothetical protein EOO11_06465 [Chitinophagaceae bacterium]|nr:MAG: hypothetical protein EOO11_06465 [Chitinophagaceae bacterium]